MKSMLILEDGSLFEGNSIGVAGEKMGEVVLNTSVVGYQESMTDPANAGKILIFTYPLIGNYGVAKKFFESRRSFVNAVIIKEESRMFSNWQAEDSFNNFLKKEKVVAISEVDTRTLAVRIRNGGQMLGILSTKGAKKDVLLKKLNEYKQSLINEATTEKQFYNFLYLKNDFIKLVSTKKIKEINGKSGPKIAILDIGILNSFIKQLRNSGCNILLLPYNTNADKILELKPDGLVIPNGPEEDKAIPGIVTTVQKLLGKIPMMGISTGHELIYLALGGKLQKLKVGHHGSNYPVKSPSSYKGHITVQNHSFIADEDSLKGRDDIKITLRHVNDNSIEEMESKKLKFISTQYYPVSPGSDEVNTAFKKFLNIIKGS